MVVVAERGVVHGMQKFLKWELLSEFSMDSSNFKSFRKLGLCRIDSNLIMTYLNSNWLC
jgi:hypothetical protein